MAALSAITALLIAAGSSLSPAVPDTMLVESRVLGSFQHASRVVLNPQGWVYVTDTGRNVVVLMKDDGQNPVSVGGYGWTQTTFDQPTGLATDGLNLFVSDYGNHRLQRFDRNLNFISSFSTRDTSYVSARFGYPSGVALSRFGDLFILDGENLRVMKFTEGTRFERSFGDIDDQRSRLRQPIKILVGPDDLVYVLEPDRLIVFDYFGHYLRTVGEGVLSDARGFCLLPSGILVVAESELYWFNDRGALWNRAGVQEINTSSPLAPMEDAAVSGEELYVLAADMVHVFPLAVQRH